MPATCPYCKNNDTKVYYSIELPIYAWPLPPGESNFMVPVEISLCTDCWYAFNSKPLSEELLKLIYDNYVYISPSSGIGHSSANSEVMFAESFLSGRNVKNIVLGSQFTSEMRKKLEDWNCKPERVFSIS